MNIVLILKKYFNKLKKKLKTQGITTTETLTSLTSFRFLLLFLIT